MELCICFLGKMGVQHLDLLFSHSVVSTSHITFSCHLLSRMPSLEHLSLSRACSLQPNLNVKCRSLRIIHLSFVTMSDPGSLDCILSNCVALRVLTIRSSACPPKLCFRGPNLRLETLNLFHCSKVVEIEACADSLTTFEYACFGFFEGRLVFDHVPRLESVSFFY